MTNHHVPSLLGRLNDTLHLWRQRYETRRELAEWADRDLQDIGMSWSDVVYEAGKPFWRA
jgi:uncharacterized protein YjiS (DUF1127 family)